MTIEVITFDLDNTLWDVEPALIKAEDAQREWLLEHRSTLQMLFFLQAQHLSAQKTQSSFTFQSAQLQLKKLLLWLLLLMQLRQTLARPLLLLRLRMVLVLMSLMLWMFTRLKRTTNSNSVFMIELVEQLLQW